MADRGRCSPPFSHNNPSLACALDDPKGWNSCWGGFKCFSPRRREKYRRAETDLIPGPILVQSSTEDDSLALDVLTQVAILPPVMGAPPPSPVSFGGNGQSTSSHMSPVTLLTLFPESSERHGSLPELRFDGFSTDAHAGLFIFDNASVTPPLYSTLTTASVTPFSTAPFTPPPELAHLTTPSSPEVPFAQLLGPSLEIRDSLSEKVHEHFSLQSFPPNNHKLIHQLYSCSSIGQSVTCNCGGSIPETVPPVLDLDKGSTNAKVGHDCCVSAVGNTSLEGFGMATSESMCDKPIIVEQVLQQKAEGPGLLEQDGASSPTIAHDNSGHKYLLEGQNSGECCPRCGELSAKCKDLSEALEQTKKKLALVEKRVNSIDERERKFKQLMQWMQLGDKLQQQNGYQLLKESSWQESAFLDLLADIQECILAESSSSFPNTGEDDSSIRGTRKTSLLNLTQTCSESSD